MILVFHVYFMNNSALNIVTQFVLESFKLHAPEAQRLFW